MTVAIPDLRPDFNDRNASSWGSRDLLKKVLLFTACFFFVAVRSFLIARAHLTTIDAQYHAINGLALLRGLPMPEMVDNPPFGSALAILPVWALRLVGIDMGLQRWVETIAVWKSLVAMPIFIVGYLWARQLYGNGAGLLALLLLLIEPTLSAQIAYVGNDTVSLSSIALTLWLGYRYVSQPDWRNFFLVAVCGGVALSIKQNAVFAGVSIVTTALITWFIRPWWLRNSLKNQSGGFPDLRRITAQLLLAPAILFIVIWACVLFRFDPVLTSLPSRREHFPFAHLLLKPWPAGLYIRSVRDMMAHARDGHMGFLLGQSRRSGWWYYFPVVATYKVPIGMGLVFCLALFQWRKPKWEEVPLFISIFWFVAMCLSSTIDIGFRHALPCVFVMIIFASRCWTGWHTWKGWAVALATIAAAVDVACAFPNLVSYVNFPRDKVWLQINDSNLDWGQCLLQARDWADTHAQGRPVSYLHWGVLSAALDPKVTLDSVAGPNLHIIPEDRKSLPQSGFLLVGPNVLAGQYFQTPLVPELRDQEPIDMVGGVVAVYDIDELKRRGVKLWDSTTRPAGPTPASSPVR
jgi:hypothetical protein